MRTLKALSALAAVTIVNLLSVSISHADPVSYNGAVFTSDTRVMAGKVYVPLSDVAKWLKGKVASGSGGYQIVAAGGANQVNGTKGSVGDWIFDGKWRFKVSKVDVVSTYPYQYSKTAGTDKPSGANDLLVVLYCTLKNGMQTTEHPILGTNGLSSQVTALTDDQGQGYRPVDFDVNDASIIPAAAENFTVVFSVPKGTKLTSFIFSIYTYSDSTHVTNARIDLGNLVVNQ